MNKALRQTPLFAAALLAGACQPLGLAPFNYWPLAFFGLFSFTAILYYKPSLGFFRTSFAYGIGLYGVGVSWVFVSIHTYGNASVFLGTLLTALFVVFLGFMFALPFWCWQRFGKPSPQLFLLGFPALWALNEAYRSWIFTGFPWLHIGYGHLETPLAGWAPVLGIFGLGLLLASCAVSLLAMIGATLKQRLLAATVLIGIVGAGGLLSQKEWTRAVGSLKTVAMVQPNIPQEHKWDRDWLEPTYQRLVKQSEPLWRADWLIWPEAALPTVLSEAQPFIAAMAEQAHATQTALVTGVITDQINTESKNGRRFFVSRYFNSLVVAGQGSGLYHKQRLVPFGEYVPFEAQLRGLIQFFNLPMSVLHKGPSEQSPLMLSGTPVWPAVCYEIVYPDLIASGARSAQAILTVSNDAWFGESWAPIQHLQMAQMRALETGRYVMRATNNGISAIIDPRGKITASGEQFVQETLSGQVQPRTGNTPFMASGSSPLLIICGLLLLGLGLLGRRQSATQVA
ncbi:apolipoprotein N-acyltransferase [Simiduia litorea]|uniref:apolipoprotein N-acyltransferase n=1 Tax=Simiduia litorea TaxID=1435348 RepID=UPI0036F28807